jgi:CRISPR-associated protein Cas1
MTSNGKFLARVTGEVRGNVTLRKTQYRISDNDTESTKIARNFILGKVYNSRWIIERATRDYPLRLDVEKLKKASMFLKNSMNKILTCENSEELRGYEGEAASIYFSIFNDLILQQKENFYFGTRNKRPPLDNVNALLSFCYTMLANMTASALEAVGLDPYVGFLHKDRPGRISLALDVMEELRSVFADRFVLSLINKRIVNNKGFIKKENGAVIMTDECKKAVLSAWQSKKQEKIVHPFLEEKIEWGLVPFVQAMLLSRYLRGDLDEYPPFMWK